MITNHVKGKMSSCTWYRARLAQREQHDVCITGQIAYQDIVKIKKIDTQFENNSGVFVNRKFNPLDGSILNLLQMY